MKWYLVTCNNSEKILPAANYLLNKYVKSILPDININYIDLEDEPVNTWSYNVLKKLPDNEEYIVFGLDDFFIIDYLRYKQYRKAIYFAKNYKVNRFEIGWGASKKEAWIKGNKNAQFIEYNSLLKFGKETPYSVSCQISIWKLSELKRILGLKPMTPWEFEVKTQLDNVFCFTSENCALRYIEESAISGRQKGKVNVLGLRPSDVDNMISKGLLNAKELIYGWNGATKFTDGGEKYNEFYSL